MRDPSVPLESAVLHREATLPPLRLAHLLLYMAVCSVFLFLATARPSAGQPLTQRAAANAAYRQVIAVPGAMLNAASVTVFVLLVAWTYQRRRTWREPGHWIALWTAWTFVSLPCVRQLVSAAKWLAGVRTADDMIAFWQWGNWLYALQYLPFALLFFCLAAGWRGAANTWMWRLYFLIMAIWAIWLVLVPTRWSPAYTSILRPATLRSIYVPHAYELSLTLLLAAVAVDLMRRHPHRHWSHWVPIFQPLMTYVLPYLEPVAWSLLQSGP